jgi:biotin operon repressor
LNLNEPVLLLRSLKGCPLSIVFAMFLLRKPMGVEALARATAYSKGTVEDSLDALQTMGLVVKTSRYNGWQLTDKGYQLPLFDQDNYPAEEGAEPEPQQPAERESQNLRLPAEASDEGKPTQIELTARPIEIESQNLRLEPETSEPDPVTPSGESQNLRLDLEGETGAEPEPQQPAERESQNLRLPAEEEGAEDQKINVESQNLRLPEPLPCTHDVLKHVVVLNTDSDIRNLKQQHEHESRKGTHAHEELVQAVAEVFMADKATPEQARESAINLVNMAGPKLVRLQLDYFPARCEQAKASPKGLRNRSGLLVDSIRKNYPPPPVVDSGEKSWYSQEEFNELIEH